MVDLKAVLSENLRVLRGRHDMSQAQLAHRAGISTGYIGSIEAGHKFPSPEVLERIAAALQVRPYRMLQSEEDVMCVCDDGQFYEIQHNLEQTLLDALDKTFADLKARTSGLSGKNGLNNNSKS